MSVHMFQVSVEARAINPPGTGVTDHCEPTYIGTGNGTLVLCENNMCP